MTTPEPVDPDASGAPAPEKTKAPKKTKAP